MAFMLSRETMKKIQNWIPAFLMMGLIFLFSAQPFDKLPNFDWADAIVKKAGHMVGYGLLAFTYWYGLGMDKQKRWVAWVFVILYAMTDEYHQAFVRGRHSSIWDVLIFDNIGALISLWLTELYIKRKRPDTNV